MDKDSTYFGTMKTKTNASQSGDHTASPKKVGQELIEIEKTEIGGVKWSVYSYYSKSIGYSATAAATFFYVIYQGFSVGSNLWLSR